MILLVWRTITSSSSRMKRQWEYTVWLVSSPIWIFRISLPVTIIHVKRIDGTLSVYDTTSSKSSLWVNHGKICDFACCLPLKLSTLNLFNIVAHFDDASGFNGYIQSVETFNFHKNIPSGLIAARMTYLCEKYRIQKRDDGCTWGDGDW